MKKSTRKPPTVVGAKYFISAAGGNITSIEIVPQALSRKEYANRGRHLMNMRSLHRTRAIGISGEAR